MHEQSKFSPAREPVEIAKEVTPFEQLFRTYEQAFTLSAENATRFQDLLELRSSARNKIEQWRASRTIREQIGVRIEELQQLTSPTEITLYSKLPYTGFIHSDTLLKPNPLSAGVYLDDNRIYETFITTFADTVKKQPNLQRIKKERLIPHMIFKSHMEYFGIGESKDTSAEVTIYQQMMEFDKAYSIKKKRHAGTAKCVEEAAFAQNILAFLGIEATYLQSGFATKLEEGSISDKHIFNLVSNKGNNFIFDASLPMLHEDKYGSVVGFSPSVYPITPEDKAALLTGKGSVNVTHYTFLKDSGKITVKRTFTRVYDRF